LPGALTLAALKFDNKFSREWRDKVGYATSVNWPVGPAPPSCTVPRCRRMSSLWWKLGFQP
jgi:hypothetical protein